MKRKIGISTFVLQRKFGDKRAIEIAKQAGADAVDFDTLFLDYRDEKSIYSKSDEEIAAYFAELKRYADTLGIEIFQTHGRITGFRNIAEEDDALVENARRDLLAAKSLGAKVCVMHTVTSIHMGANPNPELMHKLDFDMFTRILPYAKKYNIKLATETFGDAVQYNACDFFGQIDEFKKAYDRVCSVEDFGRYYGICMDCGHTNKATRYNQPNPGEVVRMFGKNISALHLHDNDTFTDQHNIPMSGTIDWVDLLNALDEIGFDGVYNLELNLDRYGTELCEETAAFAVKVMRKLLDRHYKV